MKYVLVLAALLTAGAVFAADSGVIFVSHDKVDAALSKTATLVTAPDLLVMGSHREEPGKVEVHDKETDVMYIVDGDATVVTGGTGVGMTRTKPGQWIGTEIKGGESHHMTKGDVLVIPAGVPHWFKEAHPKVSYFVVKVVKP